jgi:TPR repeat protein
MPQRSGHLIALALLLGCATRASVPPSAGQEPRAQWTGIDLLKLREDLVTLGQMCADGRGEACTGYGSVLSGRNYRDPDATRWFLRGCDLGDAEGCQEYAMIGETTRNWQLAAHGWAKGCNLGHRPSCQRFAAILFMNPTTRAAAADLFEDNCAKGFGLSCTAAAVAHAPLFGHTDCKRATFAAEKTCQSKVADACAVIDACKLALDGERAAALDRLRTACDRKVQLACLYWGDAQPQAISQNAQVRRAYKIACKVPEPASMVACPRLLAIDVMSATSQTEARPGLDSLNDACTKAVGEACCLLAELHEKGTWVTPDPERIADLRSKACRLGQSRCCAAGGQ